ncbi:hypothetical protein IG631_07917 [Alternaria alternata]|nr:hypothetical protein IG631_07917 [Alternaria alternata]
MVTRGLTKTDGSSSRALSGEVRYPPTAQQFAGVRLKHIRLAIVGLAVSAFPAQRPFRSP